MKKDIFIKGFKDGIPIGLGYLAVSFSFGIMAVSGGLSVLEATLISLLNVTSAGQFAGLGIIIAGGSAIEMAMTQLIINLRYALMSVALSQKYDSNMPIIHRFFNAFGVTDEIFAISVGQSGKLSPYYVYGAMSVAIPGWVTGTFLGAILGNILPSFVISALSVALYGMFVAIVVPVAKSNKSVFYVAIAAIILSSAFYYIPGLKLISSGFVIIIVTVLVSAIAAFLAPIEEKGNEA